MAGLLLWRRQPAGRCGIIHAMIPLSVLDLAPIVEGSDAADALRRTLDLARHAEAWGYRRYLLAEHHNMDGLACSSTAVLVGHVAGGTSTIRVGSGGVMLPNHAPLVIAEQFGTLATLYPGRIDLGLGRAPGTDPTTALALRRSREAVYADDFPAQLGELLACASAPPVSPYFRGVAAVLLWALDLSPCPLGLSSNPFDEATARNLLTAASEVGLTAAQPADFLRGVVHTVTWILEPHAAQPQDSASPWAQAPSSSDSSSAAR